MVHNSPPDVETSRQLEESLGKRIEFIVDLYATRSEAAKVAGLSTLSLRRYISGEQSPSFDALARLACDRNVSLDWLAEGQGSAFRDQRSSEILDKNRLLLALETVEEALSLTKKRLDPPNKADLLLTVYNLLQNTPSEETKRQVLKIVALSA